MNKKRPDFWPSCPWPADVWPMTQEEYVKATPDPKLRIEIPSGKLLRMKITKTGKFIWKREKGICP